MKGIIHRTNFCFRNQTKYLYNGFAKYKRIHYRCYYNRYDGRRSRPIPSPTCIVNSTASLFEKRLSGTDRRDNRGPFEFERPKRGREENGIFARTKSAIIITGIAKKLKISNTNAVCHDCSCCARENAIFRPRRRTGVDRFCLRVRVRTEPMVGNKVSD